MLQEKESISKKIEKLKTKKTELNEKLKIRETELIEGKKIVFWQ